MLYRLLESPPVYRLIRWLFNADRKRPMLLSGLGYHPGMSVLDVGCGTGELSGCFAPEDYTGIDISEAYIQAARQKHKGTFHAISADRVEQLGVRYDRAFVNGMFHHIPDEMVTATLSSLRHVLKPDGYFFVMEDVWPSRAWNIPGYIIRWLDRGRYVRTARQWRALLGASWRMENEHLSASWKLGKPWRIPSSLLEDYVCVLRPPADI